jgi:hypothetical protein
LGAARCALEGLAATARRKQAAKQEMRRTALMVSLGAQQALLYARHAFVYTKLKGQEDVKKSIVSDLPVHEPPQTWM